jgi:hypothetical protein
MNTQEDVVEKSPVLKFFAVYRRHRKTAVKREKHKNLEKHVSIKSLIE